MARRKTPNLTEGEMRLMDVLWNKGQATVGDVLGSLPTHPPLAYSTVLTTLRILEAKGYLEHTKRGRAFVYAPLVARAEASRNALRHLVNRFFGGSREQLVINLLEEEAIDADELRRIKKMIATSGQGEKK